MRDPGDATVKKSQPFSKRETNMAASATTATGTPYNPLGSQTSIQFFNRVAGQHPGSDRTNTGSYVEKHPDTG